MTDGGTSAVLPADTIVDRVRRSRLPGRLLRHRLFLLGAGLLAVVVLAELAAPLLAPFELAMMQARRRFRPPELPQLFGTDSFGRDILSRVLHGARISLQVGALVVVVTGVLGTVIGALSGYVRRIDDAVMRLMDAMMAFPAVLLAIGITAALGPSLINVVIALGVAYTPRTARSFLGMGPPPPTPTWGNISPRAATSCGKRPGSARSRGWRSR